MIYIFILKDFIGKKNNLNDEDYDENIIINDKSYKSKNEEIIYKYSISVGNIYLF